MDPRALGSRDPLQRARPVLRCEAGDGGLLGKGWRGDDARGRHRGAAAEPGVPRQFPGFDLSGTASGTSALRDYHSAQIPTADNRFAGRNRARYANVDLDALIDKSLVTIPVPERDQVVAQIVRHLTENVIPLPLIYNPRPIMLSNRVTGVPMTIGEDGSGVWNAHEWAVR